MCWSPVTIWRGCWIRFDITSLSSRRTRLEISARVNVPVFCFVLPQSVFRRTTIVLQVTTEDRQTLFMAVVTALDGRRKCVCFPSWTLVIVRLLRCVLNAQGSCDHAGVRVGR